MTKIQKKVSRGGARAGAGRKRKYESVTNYRLSLPTDLAERVTAAGIKNKTQYIVSLIEADLNKKSE